MVLLIDIIAIAALLISGYAGYVSPLSHSIWWGVLPLAFPICFWVAIVLFILQLLWYRRGAFVLALGMIACGGPMLTYCPLHILSPKAQAGAEQFSLLTYNTCSTFLVADGKPDVPEYIIASGADIVCTQEAYGLAASHRDDASQALVDSLRAVYPYILFTGNDGREGFLSKYPIENIHLDINDSNFRGCGVAAVRVTLPSGRRISVFNVHLESFGITGTPLRETAENPEDSRELLEKIANACRQRARQANKIVQWLRLYAGPDAIICGDFNDVPDCYSIRTFADNGFHSVYPSIAFGPVYTYNLRHLYYCIDHVLYRGDITPLYIRKGRLKASDHYPLTVDFAIK